jgi:hypothetical protein
MEVKLTNGKFTTVDDSDIEKVLLHNTTWTEAKTGYAYAWSKILQKAIFLHRLILDFPIKSIDHINGNKLDNRKINLRACGQSLNGHNLSSKVGKKYKGVFRKGPNKYYAQIRIGVNKVCLGTFKTPLEAAKAYDEKLVEVFGHNVKTNL